MEEVRRLMGKVQQDLQRMEAVRQSLCSGLWGTHARLPLSFLLDKCIPQRDTPEHTYTYTYTYILQSASVRPAKVPDSFPKRQYSVRA